MLEMPFPTQQPFSPLQSKSTTLGMQTSSFKKTHNTSCIIQSPLHYWRLYNVSQEGLAGRGVSNTWKPRGSGKAPAPVAGGDGSLEVAAAKPAPCSLSLLAWQAGQQPCFLAFLWVYCFAHEINKICHKKICTLTICVNNWLNEDLTASSPSQRS